MTLRDVRDELDAIDRLFQEIRRERFGPMGTQRSGQHQELFYGLNQSDHQRFTELRLRLDRVVELGEANGAQS